MIRNTLLVIGGLFLLFATYLSGVRLLERVSPETAAWLGVLDPDRSLRENKRELQSALASPEGVLPNPDLAADIALSDPLSDLPYIVPLIDASSRLDVPQMTLLSEHVLRLNPRNRIGQFVQAQLAVLAGDAVPAMEALANLLTLNPAQTDVYLAEISQLAQTEAGQAAILDVLAQEPRWTGRLVRQLTADVRDTNFLIELFDYYPPGQNSYIAALANRGELERAHLTFLNYLPAELIGKTGVPFDDRFMGLPGAQPFNWRLHREYASLEPQGGLYISFFGQGRPVIAEQILRLSAGTYRTEVDISGRVHRAGGHLAWTMLCSRTGEELFVLEVLELMSSANTLEAVFDIPEDGCKFQTLRLNGVAGEFPRTTRALVRHVQISRVRPDDAS